MSKLSKSVIPGYGANPFKPNSNPAAGLAPDPETGLPKGLPQGVGKDVLRFSNPVGGIGPDVNGDIGYQKGWLDRSSNGTPAQAPKGPGYNVWADPDMTQRGWGWGMGADGALHTGVMGGGPAGSPFGPHGGPPALPAAPALPGAPAAPGSGPGFGPASMAPNAGGLVGGGHPGGMFGAGLQLANQMRAGQNPGGGMPPMGQQGPAMAPGGPQGASPMGMQPQGAPAGPSGPGQNPQAVQQLIAQMRMQQQGQAQPGQLAQ